MRPILNNSDKRKIGFSLNDCISDQAKYVQYIQQQEIVEIMMALGPDAFIWKKDIRWGFNNVHVCYKDSKKLAFYFNGLYFCYKVLPMGWRPHQRCSLSSWTCIYGSWVINALTCATKK